MVHPEDGREAYTPGRLPGRLHTYIYTREATREATYLPIYTQVYTTRVYHLSSLYTLGIPPSSPVHCRAVHMTVRYAGRDEKRPWALP